MTGRLLLFVLVLMPGWFLLLRYYFFDPFIMKNIPYGLGGKKRNLLDIYLPFKRTAVADGGEKKMKKPTGPVIIFLSGGAWIIGYKMWACLLAREFARFGYIVVCPDYRNFPQGNIEDMVADTIAALSWTKTHIELFGGDPNQIILSGQSAGAHIAACTVMHLYKASSYVTKPLTTALMGQKDSVEKSKLRQLNLAGIPAPALDGMVTPKKSSDKEEEEWEEWRSVSTAQKAPTAAGSEAASVDADETARVAQDAIAATANTDVNTTDGNTTTAGSGTDLAPAVTIRTIVDVVDDLDESFGKKSRTSSEVEYPVTIDDVKMFVGISGPYNLKALEAHFHNRGLDSAIIEWICLRDVKKYSPTHVLADIIGHAVPCQCLCPCLCAHPLLSPEAEKGVEVSPVDASTAIPAEAVAIPAESLTPHKDSTITGSNKTLEGFPAVALFHGCQDVTIPASVSTELFSLLEAAGVQGPVLKLYKDCSHTDAILEGVLSGDCQMLRDVAEVIYTSLDKCPKLNGPKQSTYEKLFTNIEEQMKSEPKVSKIRCSIARFINPF